MLWIFFLGVVFGKPRCTEVLPGSVNPFTRQRRGDCAQLFRALSHPQNGCMPWRIPVSAQPAHCMRYWCQPFDAAGLMPVLWLLVLYGLTKAVLSPFESLLFIVVATILATSSGKLSAVALFPSCLTRALLWRQALLTRLMTQPLSWLQTFPCSFLTFFARGDWREWGPCSGLGFKYNIEWMLSGWFDLLSRPLPLLQSRRKAVPSDCPSAGAALWISLSTFPFPTPRPTGLQRPSLQPVSASACLPHCATAPSFRI